MKTAIPYSFILSTVKSGHWDTLAYWMMLRPIHQKPIFYNYTARSIAKVLDISPDTANRHIKRMLQFGWAYEPDTKKGRHFKLVPPSRLLKNTLVIPVEVRSKKSENIKALKAIHFINKIGQQKRTVRRKCKALLMARNPLGKLNRKQLRYITQCGGLKKLERTYKSRVTVSNKKIGQYFGESQRTGQTLHKWMRDNGIIYSEPYFEKAPDNFCTFNYSLGNFFKYRGHTVIRYSNTISRLIQGACH